MIVIGGGDTGTDCIGTSLRHGCRSLVNFELLPKPPPTRAPDNPWPQWPRIFRTDYGHEEAAANSARIRGNTACCPRSSSTTATATWPASAPSQVEWTKRRRAVGRCTRCPAASGPGKPIWSCWPWDSWAPNTTWSESLGLELDERSNYRAEHGQFATNLPGVFAAGDCRRGQSLVVWAINEGRGAAQAIDQFLSGDTADSPPTVAAGRQAGTRC